MQEKKDRSVVMCQCPCPPGAWWAGGKRPGKRRQGERRAGGLEKMTPDWEDAQGLWGLEAIQSSLV